MSICLSVTRLWCAKTAELIEVLFVMKIIAGLRNIVLDWGPGPPRRWKRIEITFASCLFLPKQSIGYQTYGINKGAPAH